MAFTLQRDCYQTVMPRQKAWPEKSVVLFAQVSEKLYLCTVFPWKHDIFAQFLSRTATSKGNERANLYTVEVALQAQTFS